MSTLLVIQDVTGFASKVRSSLGARAVLPFSSKLQNSLGVTTSCSFIIKISKLIGHNSILIGALPKHHPLTPVICLINELGKNGAFFAEADFALADALTVSQSVSQQYASEGQIGYKSTDLIPDHSHEANAAVPWDSEWALERKHESPFVVLWSLKSNVLPQCAVQYLKAGE